MALGAFGAAVGRAGLRILLPERVTRKALPAVIGQMVQILGRGRLPSTASLLRMFRNELGLRLRTQDFYNIVRPFQEFQRLSQAFMTSSPSAVLRRSDMILSPFAENNKYRYVLGRDEIDQLTGVEARKTLSVTSNRLLSQDQLTQVIEPLGFRYQSPDAEYDDAPWALDFAYRSNPLGFV